MEFQLAAPNPIFLQHLDAVFIMSKSWSEKHKVLKPLDFKNKEESYASFNANGTGPYVLATRQPGIRTTHKRHAGWWSKHDGNVQEEVFTPISNDATRLAALVSGELDFVLDPAPRDVPRLRNTAGVKVIDGRRTAWCSSAWTSTATSCCTAASRARIRSRTSACARRCTRRSTSRR